MVKVLISYDMQQGKEQECQEYLVNKVAPALRADGFSVLRSLVHGLGQFSRNFGGGEVESLDKARTIFQSKTWETLAEGLGALTDNFKLRIVQPHPGADACRGCCPSLPLPGRLPWSFRRTSAISAV
jgi:hypothetical protein